MKLHKPDDAGQPERAGWPAGEWDRVWGAVTPPQRRLIELHVFNDMALPDAADALGLSRGTAAGMLRRARARLRAVLAAA